MDLGPGHLLKHYRIAEQLGSGGMGVVYRAWDTHLERDVAVKVLTPGSAPAGRARRMFRREALAVSRLHHPNICGVYDFDRDGDTEFIVMEYVEGKTLQARLEQGPLEREELVRLSQQLCAGLGAAHKLGYVHRDIKPGNLMIATDGTLKILDFGLVHLQRPIHEGASTVSLTEGMTGTLSYMAPEQISADPVDHRTDIYAAGCVIYEMATGKMAFPATEPASLVYKIVHVRPRAPRRSNPEVPRVLDWVILHAMEKAPARRFQTAEKLAEAMDDLRRPGPLTELRALFLDHRRRWVAVALALAVAVAVGWQIKPRPDTPDSPLPEDSRLRLGILVPLESRSDIDDEWPSLIQTMLAEGLTGAQGIAVVDPFSLNGLIAKELGAEQPGRVAGLYRLLTNQNIDLIVDGSLMGGENGFQIVSNLVDPSSGEVVFSINSGFANESELAPSVQNLAEKILGFVQVEVLGLEATRDLSPWIGHWNRDIGAIKAFMLASRYAHRNEYGSTRYLLQALEIDPDFVAPRVWLISGLVQMEKTEEARQHYLHLLSIASQATPFEQAMIAWAGAFIADNLQQQERHLEVALEYSPDNNILRVNLGETRYQLGDYEGALTAIMPSIRAHWQFPGVYSIAANSLVMLGRDEEAKRVLQDQHMPAPIDPEIYALLRALALREGDAGEEQRYRQLLQARLLELHDEASPTNMAPVYCSLARRTRDEGRLDRAAALFELAVEEKPGEVDYRSELADTLYAAGDRDGAARQYRALLQLEPDGPTSEQAQRRLGELEE